MLPIGHLASAPAWAHRGTATRGATFDADTTEFPELTAFCNDVLLRLRDGEPIAGDLRAPTLALIVGMNHWPATLAIRLHTEGDDSGRRYGPRDASLGYTESLHVKHCADGRYATAAWADAARWSDHGACADSLFEAVLGALVDREASSHRQLTAALKQGKPDGGTDAQALREGAADLIERDRATALRALRPVFADRAVAHKKGKVDAQMLWEIRAMGPDRIMQVKRTALSAIYNVSPGTLSCSISDKGDLTDRGSEIMKRADDPEYRAIQIDREELRRLATAGTAAFARPGGVEAVASERGWSSAQLKRYYDPALGLTKAGIDYVEHRAKARPDHAAVATMRPPAPTRDGRPASTGLPPNARHRDDPHRLSGIARMTAQELLQAGGLAELVEDALHAEFRGKASLADGMATKDAQRRERVANPGMQYNVITASLLAEMLQERFATRPRPLGALAGAFHVSYEWLRALLYGNYIPKARGVDLLWREHRRAVPVAPLGADVLRCVDRMVHEGRIPTDYHLLVVAYLCNVSFHNLLRHVKPGQLASGKLRATSGGLTAAGRRFLASGMPDTPAPRRTRVAPIAATSVERTHAIPATATAPASPGWQALMDIPDEDLLVALPMAPSSPPALPEEIDDIVLDIFSGVPPREATPDSPGLPEDLMDLREEDLVPLSPDPFDTSSKRPRLDW